MNRFIKMGRGKKQNRLATSFDTQREKWMNFRDAHSKNKKPLNTQFLKNVNLFVYFISSNTIQFLSPLQMGTVDAAAITRLPFEDQL